VLFGSVMRARLLRQLARSPAAWTFALAIGAAGLACTTGKIGESDPNGGSGGPGTGEAAIDGVGKMGMRRLTRKEYDATLVDLLSDTSTSGFKALPEDVRDPFDNDFTTQQASGALIDAVETLATNAAARALANPTVKSKLVTCTPTGPDDVACLKTFIRSFGKQALRRALTEEDVDRFATLSALAVEAKDFWIGVDSVLRAMLQDVRFLYRVELGAPVAGRPGVFQLDDWEIASRLSYFFWGTTPDDTLLAAAEKNELHTTSQVRAAAQRLLDSPRSRERVQRFHALWLGYEQLPHDPVLTLAMKKESAALVDRVVFEKKASWFDLFKSNDTYVNTTLATHYGLPAPAAGEGWVSYEGTKRKGLLSHGSFLSIAGKFSDTSPTQRGIVIRARLLCQDIPPPPPGVVTDAPPPATEAAKCKYDRYAMHRTGGCAGCHDKTDPVGFGLENYDQTGKYRESEPGLPECKIAGDGSLTEVGSFNGPAELGDRIIESGLLETCLVTQVYRFAMGHREKPEDQPYLTNLGKTFKSSGYRFDQLLLDLVGTEWFLYRREE
jgi:hypothetical protein